MSPRDVVLRYLELLERREVDRLDEAVAEDVVAHGPGGVEGLRGLEAFTREQAQSPFVDEQITIDDLLVDGDRVVLRYRLQCVHAGEFLGVPPSGRTLHTSGIKIYRLEGGRITEIWGEDDRLGLLHQLGLTPDLPRP